MELDDEIQPTVNALSTSMQSLQSSFLPKLSQLDEDAVVSHYDYEAQAKIYLSVAYTLALALFSHDKLHNEKHLNHPRVESTANLSMPCGGSPCDARVLLQIERIKDSIRKLKDIRESQSLKRTLADMDSSTVSKDDSKSFSSNTLRLSSSGPPSTRLRLEKDESSSISATENHQKMNMDPSENRKSDEEDIMYKLLQRPDRGIGTIVGKIIANAK